MTITLPDDLAQQLQQWVTTGGYSDPIAVIRDAFELLAAQDREILERRDEILAACDRAEEEILAGQVDNRTGYDLLAEIRQNQLLETVKE